MGYAYSSPLVPTTYDRAARKAIQDRREALRKFDVHCSCKCSLIVSCAIGKEPGCRERRREGTCPCRPRWLPVCILDAQTPHGCRIWQEGHQCRCQRLYMPRCLVTGCDRRRKGRRCECPRTPTDVCPHVLALIERFGDLTVEDAQAHVEAWAKLQRQADPAQYQEPPLPDAGGDMSTRDGAIA